ncbi:MAG: 1,4-alpha-glucan branching enzyme, partial [Candidatus Binatota bacterium]|nr:1,4-alpha-glucan branching enzyme [Candidatus Binatota bacterium]
MKGGDRSRRKTTPRRVADGSTPDSAKPTESAEGPAAEKTPPAGDAAKAPEPARPREATEARLGATAVGAAKPTVSTSEPDVANRPEVAKAAEVAEPRQVAKAPVDPETRRRLAAGQDGDPHTVLGAHALGEGRGVVVRAFHPDATSVECILDGGRTVRLDAEGDGLFAAVLADASLPLRYRLRFCFADGNSWERGDPYRFWPTLGDVDLHLFNEGKHRRLWEKLGAHPVTHDGVEGVAFAVWAPNARRASVIGEFCGWDGRLLPMRQMGSSGVWELFVPELPEG